MSRKMLRAKIHRALVTDANLEYEGSISIDAELLRQAGIAEYEQVQVVNLANGARFETYTISGRPGSGSIELNGAAARLVQRGDEIIIMAHELVSGDDLPGWQPKILLLDQRNQVKEILC